MTQRTEREAQALAGQREPLAPPLGVGLGAPVGPVAPVELPAAVLWDLDGTLVDTEPYWIEAEHELVAAHGGVWSTELAHQLVGNALEVSAQMIIERSGIALSVRGIIDALLERVIHAVGHQVPWRPGARELLFDLQERGVPNALVTMSWRNLVDAIVTSLPEGVFDVLVTGDEVQHGKPHPEPYLRAATLLGVAPEDCVALEDSPTGVRSATAAGVPTIAIPNVVPVPPTRGAVQVGSLAGLAAPDLKPLATRHVVPSGWSPR